MITYLINLTLSTLFVYSILIIIKYLWSIRCAIVFMRSEGETNVNFSIFESIKPDFGIAISYFISYLLVI